MSVEFSVEESAAYKETEKSSAEERHAQFPFTTTS
jgi:hypothetical protein